MSNTYHIPVMLQQCIEGLKIKDNGIYVDTTLGGAGHTRAILESNPTAKVVAFDQDADAIERAQLLVKEYEGRLILCKDNFVHLRTHLALHGFRKIDGILFDLGVSFHQIDTADRGFSFMKEGKLDMRMNQEAPETAADIINHWTEADLADVFYKYGEERESRRIARAIVLSRQKQAIDTTLQLAELLDSIINKKDAVKAKARIFQALRIQVNKELEVLTNVMKDALEVLNTEGRIVVMSYHSLEDRIIKHFFQYEAKTCTCPDRFPQCICDKKQSITIITRKPIIADTTEVRNNPCARSAKLRIAEKVGI